MTSIERLKDTIGEFGRDTRLNLGAILSPEGAPGLSLNQIFGIALASAHATKSTPVITAIKEAVQGTLTPEEIEAAKSSATIMAMNNIYYRFLHLSEDKSFSKLPAKLRMNVIGKPGVAKTDFELFSLAVSALSGCGMCINAHVEEVRKGGVSNEGIQSAIRIAAVVNSAAQAVHISEHA